MERYQSEFTELDFQGSPMNLHKRESLTKIEVVVVFVHGLMGSGYGTWADFPKYLFEGESDPKCDVAVFDYYSGNRKWFNVRPNLKAISRSLSERLAYLAKNYEHVYVVAHSMGGLISLHALKHYLDHRDRATKKLKRVAGIMLLGCPLDGSKWSLAARLVLFREAGYLRRRAPHQRSLRKYFDSRVEIRNLSIFGESDYQIALYSGTADFDKYVTEESATFGVSQDQHRPFVEDHLSLVKPPSADADQVDWVMDMLRDVTYNRDLMRYSLKESTDADRPRLATKAAGTDDGSTLVTDILREIDAHEWWAIYKDVVASASTAIITVCDRSDPRSQSRDSTLLFCIGDSDRVIEGNALTVDLLAKAKNAYLDDDVDVRIVAVGDDVAGARDALIKIIEPGSLMKKERELFLKAVRDDIELSEQLQRYITVLTSDMEDKLRARFSINDDLRIEGPGL